MSVTPTPLNTVTVTETKPGYKTTEFWATAGTWLLVLLQNVDWVNVVPGRWGEIILAASALFVTGKYNESRGKAKQGVAYSQNDSALDDEVRPSTRLGRHGSRVTDAE